MRSGIVAIDIGGSHITSVMIENLETGDFATSFQKTKIDSLGSRNSIIAAWHQNISTTIEKAPAQFANKIAIAIPGPFDWKDGIGQYTNTGKFAALSKANIRELLQSHFQQELSIHFENDAACFGLGECYFGQAREYTKSMAITLGTGIGCSFLENRIVIKEGHTVPPGGEIFHLPYKNATADDFFSTRWFVKRTAEQYGLKITGVKELTLLSPTCSTEAIFLEFAENLVAFLVPIALKFGAEAILFGGNISKAWSYFSGPLQSKFAKYSVDILRSELDEMGICLGAAIALSKSTSKATIS